MKKRIVIEDCTVTVEGAKNYPSSEIIADLLLSLVEIAKASGVKRKAIIKSIKVAWKYNKQS